MKGIVVLIKLLETDVLWGRLSAVPEEPHLLGLCSLKGAKWPHDADSVKDRVTRQRCLLELDTRYWSPLDLCAQH